jgi:hypothetical protein
MPPRRKKMFTPGKYARQAGIRQDQQKQTGKNMPAAASSAIRRRGYVSRDHK